MLTSKGLNTAMALRPLKDIAFGPTLTTNATWTLNSVRNNPNLGAMVFVAMTQLQRYATNTTKLPSAVVTLTLSLVSHPACTLVCGITNLRHVLKISNMLVTVQMQSLQIVFHFVKTGLKSILALPVQQLRPLNNVVMPQANVGGTKVSF